MSKDNNTLSNNTYGKDHYTVETPDEDPRKKRDSAEVAKRRLTNALERELGDKRAAELVGFLEDFIDQKIRKDDNE